MITFRHAKSEAICMTALYGSQQPKTDLLFTVFLIPGNTTFSFPYNKSLKLCCYKTINLPVVLYRCETWSLTVREEHKLRVFENRVLRIFGPKRDGVMGGWRKLHKEELHNLYSLPSIIRIIKSRRMRWAGHVA
jgi:hypothetical protein